MSDNTRHELTATVIGCKEVNGGYICSFSTLYELPHSNKGSGPNKNLFFNKIFTKAIYDPGTVLELRLVYAPKARDGGGVWHNYAVYKCRKILNVDQEKDYLKVLVSEQRYENIIKAYPDFVKRVRKKLPIDHNKITGIGEKSLEMISKKVRTEYWRAELLMWLRPFNITEKMITNLLGKYKNPSQLKYKLETNPYVLTEVRGMAFTRVDEMVLKIYPEKRDSEFRLAAFIEEYMRSIGNTEGHTVHSIKKLKKACEGAVKECMHHFNKHLAKKPDYLFIKNDDIGLSYHYNQERAILDQLIELRKAYKPWKKHSTDYIIKTEKELGHLLSEEQKEAIESIWEHNVIFLTGAAGVGKTSVIRGILNALINYNVGLCSLAAKASVRMTEVTGGDAYTYHRLLEWNGKKFKYNKENKLFYDVIINDETGMSNLFIIKSLLEAVKIGKKVIFVGDDAQLSPIGAGSFFKDMLKSDFKVCRLTKIYRQASQSGIIVDANFIRQGQNPLHEMEDLFNKPKF